MPKSPIEIRVHARGTLRDEQAAEDPSVVARCDLCGGEADAVASVSSSGAAAFACKECLRERLELITVGVFSFKVAAKKGLPWGKISG
ncbi:MAG: hypothetical protein IPI67_07015 [Myxococcales bacterium]|nr:hypothetical protein [Myxococcales bacterium]